MIINILEIIGYVIASVLFLYLAIKGVRQLSQINQDKLKLDIEDFKDIVDKTQTSVNPDFKEAGKIKDDLSDIVDPDITEDEPPADPFK